MAAHRQMRHRSTSAQSPPANTAWRPRQQRPVADAGFTSLPYHAPPNPMAGEFRRRCSPNHHASHGYFRSCQLHQTTPPPRVDILSSQRSTRASSNRAWINVAGRPEIPVALAVPLPRTPWRSKTAPNSSARTRQTHPVMFSRVSSPAAEACNADVDFAALRRACGTPALIPNWNDLYPL
jgi:hypothetical protein